MAGVDRTHAQRSQHLPALPNELAGLLVDKSRGRQVAGEGDALIQH
jgi:hypothetical protein